LIVIAHIFIWGSGFAAFLWEVQALNPYLIRPGGASLGSVTVPAFGSGGILTAPVLGFFTGIIVLLSIPNLCSFVRDKISKPERLELGIGETTAIPRQIAMARFGDTSRVDTAAKAANLSVGEYLGKIPVGERAKYHTSSTVRKILGGK
jgi:hypothetical protein